MRAVHFALVIFKRNDKAARVFCQQRAQVVHVFASQLWRQRDQRCTVVEKRVGGAGPELKKISVADLNVGGRVANLSVQSVLVRRFAPFRIEVGNRQGAEFYSGDIVAPAGQPAHVQAFPAQGNKHRAKPALGHTWPVPEQLLGFIRLMKSDFVLRPAAVPKTMAHNCRICRCGRWEKSGQGTALPAWWVMWRLTRE